MGTKAKESQQVEKARKKLQRKIARENRFMTEESLAQMARLIERQLIRHAGERIDLKSKEIQLFDENRHPALVKSRFVAHLLRDLKTEATSPSKPKKTLKGRIS